MREAVWHTQGFHSLQVLKTSTFLVLCTLLLSSCGGPPDVYAPPIERKPMDVYGADLMGPFSAFGTPGSAIHIAGGVDGTPMSGAWRWALPHAELRFYLPSNRGWSAKMDFAIAKTVLDKTGPQTLTIFVNNNRVDQLRYDHDGNFTWMKPIPAEMLTASGMNYIRVETDKTQQTENGKEIAFILTRAGFIRPTSK